MEFASDELGNDKYVQLDIRTWPWRELSEKKLA